METLSKHKTLLTLVAAPCLKQASSSATFKLTVAAGFFCVQKLDIGALQACSDLILAVGAVLARS